MVKSAPYHDSDISKTKRSTTHQSQTRRIKTTTPLNTQTHTGCIQNEMQAILLHAHFNRNCIYIIL